MLASVVLDTLVAATITVSIWQGTRARKGIRNLLVLSLGCGGGHLLMAAYHAVRQARRTGER